jgi:quinol monooxygenase YgiN
MYSLTIVLEPLVGKRDELIAACLATVEPTRAEPGCLFFDVLVSETEVVFYEAYRDEAAFQAHMAAGHTKEWQVVALPHIERSKIRFPAHRGVASAPK